MKLLPILGIIVFVSSCNGRRSTTPSIIAGDTAKPLIKKVSITPSSTDTIHRNIKKFNSRYNFEAFQTNIFIGKLALPNFHGNQFANEKEYQEFIAEGCKRNGINFGGHYTIIHKGCGAMCEHIFIVDRISGKVFTDVKPNDGRYGYLYRKDSRLLIANSNVFQDESLKYYSDFLGEPELYVWKQNNFIRLQ